MFGPSHQALPTVISISTPVLPASSIDAGCFYGHKALGDDDIPELGLDETPPPEKDLPVTPQSFPSAYPFPANTDPEQTPTKPKGGTGATSASFASTTKADVLEVILPQWFNEYDHSPESTAPYVHSFGDQDSNCFIAKTAIQKHKPVKTLFPISHRHQREKQQQKVGTITEAGGVEISTCNTNELLASGDSSRQPSFVNEVANQAKIRTRTSIEAASSQVEVPAISHVNDKSCAGPLNQVCASEPLLNVTTRKNLTRILPYDTVDRLRSEPGRCVSSKVSDLSTRCLHRLKETEKGREQIRAARSEYASCPPTLEGAINLITALLAVTTCGQGKHRQIAETGLQELLRYEKGYRAGSKSSFNRKKNPFTACDLDAIPGWLCALTTLSANSGTKWKAERQSCSDSLSSDSVQPEQCETLERILTVNGSREVKIQHHLQQATENFISASLHQNFVKYTTKGHRTPLKEAIHKLMDKELGEGDPAAGYIYMYWAPPNFGYVKIGRTTRNIDVRLKEWKTKCGHEIATHKLEGKDETSNMSMRIPYISRVERLIHIELRDRRRVEIQCQKCGTGHNEWFEVSPEWAKQVVQRWSQWMIEKQASGEAGDVRSMCTPITYTPPESPQSTIKDRRRSAPKKTSQRIVGPRPQKSRQTPEIDTGIKLEFKPLINFCST